MLGRWELVAQMFSTFFVLLYPLSIQKQMNDGMKLKEKENIFSCSNNKLL
jgi:hypothetical protein